MGTREEFVRLERALSALWNLGDNVLLAWSHGPGGIRVLSVRHYAIAESVHAGGGGGGGGAGGAGATAFINDILSGPKYFDPVEFAWICKAFGSAPHAIDFAVPAGDERVAAAVSGMIRRYGVSLVRDRAVVLLDAVAFSLSPPLDQMAMLNSLSYSVNSACSQLRSKSIDIDFARTTTGDGFYIWNRATTPHANTELYKLMMMLLADNAVAQRKGGPWVPRLRAAFHVGEHYEFHQVEGLNPSHFSYIVGQVTVDLARMLEHALPGQILLGDFPGRGTLDFVARTASTLDQLNGLEISGGRIDDIRCYLTGAAAGGGEFLVNRYELVDKHGSRRSVYNAKINIHRLTAGPIFVGLRTGDLGGFGAALVESIAPAPAVAVRQRTDASAGLG